MKMGVDVVKLRAQTATLDVEESNEIVSLSKILSNYYKLIVIMLWLLWNSIDVHLNLFVWNPFNNPIILITMMILLLSTVIMVFPLNYYGVPMPSLYSRLSFCVEKGV